MCRGITTTLCGGASVEKLLSMMMMMSSRALSTTSSHRANQSENQQKRERKKERKDRRRRHQLPKEKEEKREKSANNSLPKIFSAFSVASRFGSPATTKGMNAMLSSDFNRSNVSPMDATPSSFVAMIRVVRPPRLFDFCTKSPPPFRREPVVLLVLCRDEQQQGRLLLPRADVVDIWSRAVNINVDKMTLNIITKKKGATKKRVPSVHSVQSHTQTRKESILCTRRSPLFWTYSSWNNCLGFWSFFSSSLFLSFFVLGRRDT